MMPLLPVQVVRIFAFNNGENGISTMPIQNPVGVFHEPALEFYDYVLAVASSIGIRLLLCLNNHWCILHFVTVIIQDWHCMYTSDSRV